MISPNLLSTHEDARQLHGRTAAYHVDMFSCFSLQQKHMEDFTMEFIISSSPPLYFHYFSTLFSRLPTLYLSPTFRSLSLSLMSWKTL